MLTHQKNSTATSRAVAAPPPGRPVRLDVESLADAVSASRRQRRELVLHALEMSRAASRKPRPVSRFI